MLRFSGDIGLSVSVSNFWKTSSNLSRRVVFIFQARLKITHSNFFIHYMVTWYNIIIDYKFKKLESETINKCNHILVKFDILFFMIYPQQIKRPHYIIALSVFTGLVCLVTIAKFSSASTTKRTNLNKNIFDSRPAHRCAFIIGVDGVGSLPSQVETPGIHRVVNNGIYTFSAETVSPTFSAECWSSLLHGVTPDQHKVSTFGQNRAYPSDSQCPSIFRVLHEQNPSAIMASFVNWKFINDFIIEHDIGVKLFSMKTEEELINKFSEFVNENDPTLVFFQLDNTDTAGHYFGFFSERQRKQLMKTDETVNELINIIEKVDNTSLILIQADHGGGGENPSSHGSDSPLDKLIFWTAKGEGIPKHQEVSAVSMLDTAMIVAEYLRLKPASTWSGKVPKPSSA
ncbi:hypothetical protein TRFO_22798 [Tritrichomonas foetus]|uniref:Uncharacterized protein n=1 Tax=Tritrichomonas foetus TaxID=1144522 RepID=A0A1J4KFQ4_9EUKA|nr:hypothetical protein TRFO_22798 [Tritrichomonas foetus]|eukprot:OHT08612.1 hypothetical protein TRFO_22798 [Tritrichomonas foetus]